MQTETDMEIVMLPNPGFENSVQEVYTSFSSNHDLSVLKGVSLLVIIGIYFYANDQKDPETMWHLYNLRFDGSEETEGSIGFQRGNTLSVSTQMALNEDFVWEIEQIILSPMFFE